MSQPGRHFYAVNNQRTAEFNVSWEVSRLPTPRVEITQEEFLRQFLFAQSLLEGTFIGNVRIHGHEGLFQLTVYVFPERILACASLYTFRDLWDGKGAFIPLHPEEKNTDGFQTFFYRIGCKHPAVKREDLPGMMKRVTCLECGHSSEFSTDG